MVTGSDAHVHPEYADGGGPHEHDYATRDEVAALRSLVHGHEDELTRIDGRVSEQSVLLATHEQSIIDYGKRIKALEDGVIIIPDPVEPPTGEQPKPWDGGRVGFAKAIVAPSRWERVSSAESLRDALRSGSSVMLAERQRLGGLEFEVADGAWLAAEGVGATVFGNGSDPVLRPRGRGCAHNLVIEGLNRGSTNEDGVKAEDGCDYWLDKCALRLTHDEQIDMWNPGRKRLTVTRSALLGDDGREFGPLMGRQSGSTQAVDLWLTMWRTYLETASRQPRIAAPGAVAHLVNTVHAYWWAGAPIAIDVAAGGVAILEGPIFGRDNTGGGIAAGVSNGPGGVYVSDVMLLDNDVQVRQATGVPRPPLPYADIPHEHRQTVAERRTLATQITEGAGPRLAHESGYFVRRSVVGI